VFAHAVLSVPNTLLVARFSPMEPNRTTITGM
jgi:hypothetical protein